MTQNQSPATGNARPRCIVYIDGFNMYNGSIKGTAHKWLDLQRYFEMLRQHDDVVQIHYFTALMDGSPGVRRQVYLNALETLPKVNVVAGRYKRKTSQCRVQHCTYTGSRLFPTWEEKRTDVNIAVQLVADAYDELCDTFVVVSGDSDLVPPLHHIKSRFPHKKLVVYIPARDRARGAAVEMRSAADKHATLPMALLSRCQFQADVPDGQGGVIRKPPSW